MPVFVEDAAGLKLYIKASPGAKHTAILGVLQHPRQPLLKIALAAPPDKGRANDLLVAFIANLCGCAVKDVLVVAGAQHKNKILLLPNTAAIRQVLGQLSQG